MTWTAILHDGSAYSHKVFYGSNDKRAALKEAQKKFGEFWPPAVTVIALVAGENEVYIGENNT